MLLAESGGIQNWGVLLAAMLALVAFSLSIARRARERAARAEDARRQHLAEMLPSSSAKDGSSSVSYTHLTLPTIYSV